MRIPRFPVTLPWHGLALISLCALYLLAGLTGHDPWKNDDAIHFGIVHGLRNSPAPLWKHRRSIIGLRLSAEKSLAN